MQQRDWVAVAISLGAAFTIVGPFLGVRALRKERNALRDGLARVKEISREPNLSNEERDARRREAMPQTSSWSDVEYFREWVRFYVLDHALSGLGWAAFVTVVGIILGAGGGVWSLYLPSDAPKAPAVHSVHSGPSSTPRHR